MSNTQSKSGPLANLNHDEIITRIAAGEYAAHIAPELGVTKQALHYQIRKHPKYREAREMGCELRIDQAMAQFDALKIPRPPLKPLPDAEADATTIQARLDQWKQDYQTWKDGLRLSTFDLARVESQFRAICWQAEREFPEKWGGKSAITVNILAADTLIAADLGDLLKDVTSKSRVIDATEAGLSTVSSAPTAE